MTAKINDGLSKRERARRRRAAFRCSVDGCEKPPSTWEPLLCAGHRARLFTRGTLDPSPVATHREKLRQAWARLGTSAATQSGECWLWDGGVTSAGYGAVKRNGETLAHRAAWVQVYGAIPDGLIICHRCDVRRCFRPSHLFLGTHADNTADRIQKGRTWAGDGRVDGRIKLSDDEVDAIRKLTSNGGRAAEIAERFSVSVNHVLALARGAARQTRTGVTPDPSRWIA